MLLFFRFGFKMIPHPNAGCRKRNTLIIKEYRPPSFIKWFFHALIEVIKKDDDKQIRISIVVENFRTLFYWFFLFISLFGMFLTKVFVKDSSKILESVFGASNLCANFDFAPSTYVLPFCYIFPMVAAITYDVISMFRIWIAYEEGKITKKGKNMLFAAHIYFMLSVMVFSIIFA